MPTLADKAVTARKVKGMTVTGQSATTTTSKDSIAHSQMMDKLSTAIKKLKFQKKYGHEPITDSDIDEVYGPGAATKAMDEAYKKMKNK